MVRNTGGSFLLVIVILSMLGLGTSNPRPGAKPRTAEASSLSEKSQASNTSQLDVFIRENIASNKDAKARIANLQFAIAFVPDPVHTHLALFFDRTIEALQEAAQDQGYLFTAARMPWPTPAASAKPESRDGSSSGEKAPGVMVFRGSSSGPDLVVLVVGERPTSGIDRTQFSAALALMKAFSGATPQQLRVIGPTFSGSLFSFGKALRDDKELALPRVVVRSGTITGIVHPEEKYPELKGIDFVSFSENDTYLLHRTVDFVHKLGFKSDQIALLSEDETAYGASDPNTGDVLKLYFPREISQLRSAYQASTPSERAPSDKQGQRTTLPLDLESSGNDDDSVATFSRKQTPLSQEAVLMGLVQELRLHASRFIVIRATDPLDQLFLARYLRTAYPVGRIVVIGSDLLFAREVQDARMHGLITVTTYPNYPGWMHLLYGTSKHTDRVFPSSLSTGIYNAAVSAISGQRFQHNGDSVLIDDPERLFGYAWPVIAIGDRTSEAPPLSSIASPPVHFAVLGHDGFWPLAIGWQPSDLQERAPVSDRSSLPQFKIEAATQRHIASPVEWEALQVIAIILAIAYSVALIVASITNPEDRIAQLARVRNDGRSWVLCLLAGFLLALLLLTVWPMFALPLSERMWLSILTLCAALLLTAVAAYDQLRRGSRGGALAIVSTAVFASWALYRSTIGSSYYHFEFVYRSMHLTSGISPVFPVLLLIGAGCWWSWYTVGGSTLADARCPRLPPLHASDQEWHWEGSPVKTLAASAAEMQAAVRQSAAVVDVAVAQPSTQGSVSIPHREESALFLGMARSITADDNRCLQDLLAASTFDLRIFGPLLLLVFFAVLLVDRHHPVLTVELVRYNQVMAILILVSTFALVGTTLRLRTIWIEARRLLISLDSHRLRHGFRRVKGLYPQPIWQVGSGNLSDFRRMVSRERESLQCAIKAGAIAPPDNSFDRDTADVMSTYERLKATKRFRIFEDDTALIEKFGGIQRDLANAGRAALLFLQTSWDAVAAGDSTSCASADKTPDGDPKVRFAEEFLCMLYANFILAVLIRIRSLVVAMSGLYILTLLAVSVYPFEPKVMIRWVMSLVLVYIVAVVAFVYAAMHRDSTLSNITDTNPGELGSAFWLRMVAFIAPPLISLAVSQFPELNDLLFSWVQPGLQSLGK